MANATTYVTNKRLGKRSEGKEERASERRCRAIRRTGFPLGSRLGLVARAECRGLRREPVGNKAVLSSLPVRRERPPRSGR